MRARDLGVVVGSGRPGAMNAITDVAGVGVGHHTIVRDEGPVRTGVTVVLPHADGPWTEPVFAGSHRLNGNGDVTGLEWVRECGQLGSPIGITNTHSVGVVRDEFARLEVEARDSGAVFWALPVVAETWDGVLNDINGFHVGPEHARAAYERVADGPVSEGNVGGGTGMICHGFKGGIGTASRVVDEVAGGWTVGVLVQANHGRRSRLAVNGAPVGRDIGPDVVPLPVAPRRASDEGAGSIIVIVATDAPLLPHQCDRLAQRAMLGVARTGGAGENSSGDFAIAFATGNRLTASGHRVTRPIAMLSDAHIDPLFYAAIEATEEAILNALLAAETMTGRDGIMAHALPPDRLIEVLDTYGLR